MIARKLPELLLPAFVKSLFSRFSFGLAVHSSPLLIGPTDAM